MTKLPTVNSEELPSLIDPNKIAHTLHVETVHFPAFPGHKNVQISSVGDDVLTPQKPGIASPLGHKPATMESKGWYTSYTIL